MNELIDQFGDQLAVLAFPCNQFGHQENTKNEEVYNLLHHVRPGNSYEPKMDLFAKVEVNGDKADPIFEFLKEALPVPSDDTVSLMTDPKFIIWSPVRRYDVSWNFEKFLIDTEGNPFKRFSRHYLTIDIAKDIEELLQG
ncbi:glutathione peroxidase 1-like isoform X2 [Oratosquilla oratoria]|uniref:glutathione peroxidase 1-like isoform X2 n=1 Tax=Oratosquilla oratoria TaxID=337810 RepID=UPI003F76E128